MQTANCQASPFEVILSERPIWRSLSQKENVEYLKMIQKGIDSAMIRISAWGYHKNYHADNNKNHVKDIQCIFVWCQTYCNKKKEPGKISNIQGLLQEFQVMGSTWALPNILWVPDVKFWRFYLINLPCLQKSMGSTTILQKNQWVPLNPWNPL